MQPSRSLCLFLWSGSVSGGETSAVRVRKERCGLHGTFQMIRAQRSASTSKRTGGTSFESVCWPLATSSTKLTACMCKGLALLAMVLELASLIWFQTTC